MTDKESRERRILSVLFALSKVTNSEIGVEGLLRAVACEVKDLMGANSCSVMLLDDARSCLKNKAAAGLTPLEEERITFVMGEGVAGIVAATGRPAIIDDATFDPRFATKPGQVLTIMSLACTPLVLRGEVIGVITVTHPEKSAFNNDDVQLLTVLGNAIVLDIENARLYRLAVTDALTRAFNRQYLYKKLPDEIERARRYNDSLSLMIYDIDNFKALNDSNGHPAGDYVLSRLTTLVRENLRETDTLVRWGGDEFLVVLPRCDSQMALNLAERLVRRIAGCEFPWGGTPLSLTLSIGVTALASTDGAEDPLIARADQALYAAKSAGRNRATLG
ncbi:MAG: sensor domain-containing diguanylate cyclase [Deltaproteobacteria bacterium]|nr:sensor domain-containing diguanylate cyclase [Deltaproteobacteria bacterium]